MPNVPLDETIMVEAVAQRWKALSFDAKATLEYAFNDAITHHWRVAQHRSHTISRGSQEFEIHEFRIGYARFVITAYPEVKILTMSLEDDLVATEVCGLAEVSNV